ncbi:MAG: ABC transporter substrate-binding protein, partial [Chloroflexota bacterium]
MIRKILWLAAIGLMALSLVMAACGPAATPTTPTAPTTPTTPTTPTAPTTPTTPVEEKVQKEAIAPAAEVPQYGGTLNVAVTTNPSPKGFWTYEKYLFSDWTRGPAGSNQYDPMAGASGFEDNAMPGPAESWSMPTPGVWVLNIRQGMHWAQTPFPASQVMNGREVTAADVVWSFNWELGSPKSWIWTSQPVIAKASSINQTGPWQVTMRTPIDYLTSYVWLIGAGGGYAYLAPREVTEKYNHQMIYQGEGWPYQEVVSTGPYIFTEVVASSYTKQIRNTNYWMKDPVGPGKGNQLPYIDAIVTLTIPDRSTSLAALRTGKIDYLGGFTKEEWEREMKQTPRYKWAKSMSNTQGNRVIFMRTDKQDKPFKDIRVRQALMMATDFNAFKNDYYGGAAEIDVWPVNSNFKSNIYTPLNEMPQSVQDLY